MSSVGGLSRRWMTEIDRFAGPDVNKMLVGNKADMKSKKQVDFATAKVDTPRRLSAQLALYRELASNPEAGRCWLTRSPSPGPPRSPDRRNSPISTGSASSRPRQRRTKTSRSPSWISPGTLRSIWAPRRFQRRRHRAPPTLSLGRTLRLATIRVASAERQTDDI